MKKLILSKSNFELWLSLGKAHHLIELARQKELNRYRIPYRQTHVLRTIKALGLKATLAAVAKEVDRKPAVISKQAINMEKDGLINRIRDTPKSSLLRLELTEKGLQMVKVASKSKSYDEIFSFLTEEVRQQMKSNLEQMSINAKKYVSDY